MDLVARAGLRVIYEQLSLEQQLRYQNRNEKDILKRVREYGLLECQASDELAVLKELCETKRYFGGVPPTHEEEERANIDAAIERSAARFWARRAEREEAVEALFVDFDCRPFYKKVISEREERLFVRHCEQWMALEAQAARLWVKDWAKHWWRGEAYVQ